MKSMVETRNRFACGLAAVACTMLVPAATAQEEAGSFEVPANSKFDLVVKEFADYCCSYIEE